MDAGWLTAVVTGWLWRAFEFVGRGGCDFLARGGIPGHVPGNALLLSVA